MVLCFRYRPHAQLDSPRATRHEPRASRACTRRLHPTPPHITPHHITPHHATTVTTPTPTLTLTPPPTTHHPLPASKRRLRQVVRRRLHRRPYQPLLRLYLWLQQQVSTCTVLPVPSLRQPANQPRANQPTAPSGPATAPTNSPLAHQRASQLTNFDTTQVARAPVERRERQGAGRSHHPSRQGCRRVQGDIWCLGQGHPGQQPWRLVLTTSPPPTHTHAHSLSLAPAHARSRSHATRALAHSLQCAPCSPSPSATARHRPRTTKPSQPRTSRRRRPARPCCRSHGMTAPRSVGSRRSGVWSRCWPHRRFPISACLPIKPPTLPVLRPPASGLRPPASGLLGPILFFPGPRRPRVGRCR